MRFQIMSAALAVLTMLMCATLPIQAAVVKPDVEPNWENTTSLHITLSFPDYGYAETSIVGKSGVTLIIIDIYVYMLTGATWTYVAGNHTTIYGRSGVASCQFTPIPNTYYRADYMFTVTRNGMDEIIDKSQYKIYE